MKLSVFSQAAEHIGGHLPLCKYRMHTTTGCPSTKSRGHGALCPPRSNTSLPFGSFDIISYWVALRWNLLNMKRQYICLKEALALHYLHAKYQIFGLNYKYSQFSSSNISKWKLLLSKQEGQKTSVTLGIICLLSLRMTKRQNDEYCLRQHPDKQKVAS